MPNPQKQSAMLQAALAYHSRGLAVLPIKAGTKKPALRQWECFQEAGPTEAMVRKWFAGGDKSLAILAGRVSGGLVVRDFDELGAYGQWAQAHPELAETLPTVETVRGRHVYFRSDLAAIRRMSKTGKGCILNLGDGELRAGGYCLAPPSIHPDGKPYAWIIPLAGELPILDVVAAGFMGAMPYENLLSCNREGRESAETRADREDKEDRENGGLQRGQKTLGRVVFANGPTVEAALQRTLPSGPGERHRAIFELARELKAIPTLADAEGKALRSIVQQWHARALPTIGTKPFDETWFDFLEGWDKVEYPAGTEPMAMIFAAAVEADAPAEAGQYEQEKLRLLVTLCRELQRASGEGPFYLAARTAGRLLEIDPATAARWLRGLRNDGILRLAEEGNRTARKANRYVYLATL